MQDSLDGRAEAAASIPNTWSKDGTVALAGMAVSDDGKYLAYGVAEAGCDWNTWNVLDVDTRQAARRRAEVGQVQRRVVDAGRQGLLLQPLPRAEEGRGVPGPERQPEALSTTRSARRRARTCWSTSGPTTRSGRFNGERERGRQVPRSSRSATAPTSRKVRIAYKDLSEPYGKVVDLDRRIRERVQLPRQRRPASSTSRPTSRRPKPGHRHRHDEAGQEELEDDHPRGEGDARRRRASSATASSQLPEGREDAGEGLRPGRQVRPRRRAARHRHRERLRRQARPTPRRSTPSPASPRRRASIATTSTTGKSTLFRQAEGEVQPRRLRGRSRSSTRARTARRCRCSSRTRRASSSTARTRRCSTATAASTSR